MFVRIEAKKAKEKMFYEKHFFDQKAPNGFQCFITVFYYSFQPTFSFVLFDRIRCFQASNSSN